MELILSKGSKLRLKRIQELKNLDEKNAVEYALSVAWLVTERQETKKKSKLPANVITIHETGLIEGGEEVLKRERAKNYNDDLNQGV